MLLDPYDAEFKSWPPEVQHIYRERIAILREDSEPATPNQEAIARREARAELMKIEGRMI